MPLYLIRKRFASPHSPQQPQPTAEHDDYDDGGAGGSGIVTRHHPLPSARTSPRRTSPPGPRIKWLRAWSRHRGAPSTYEQECTTCEQGNPNWWTADIWPAARYAGRPSGMKRPRGAALGRGWPPTDNGNARPVSVLPRSHEPHGHFPSPWPVRVHPTQLQMRGPVSFDFPQTLKYRPTRAPQRLGVHREQHPAATTGIVACGNPEQASS